MHEIEMKARVQDRDEVGRALDRFAVRSGSLVRDDRYFGTCEADTKRIRIRTERSGSGTRYLVTYKRKELHRTDKTTIEVNDERECTVSDPAALVAFLEDTGRTVQLEKHKEVVCWTAPVELESPAPFGGSPVATFELCRVPPLGDFLEIEILSPCDDPSTVNAVHAALEALLLKCGLSPADIESRPYSLLLKGV